MKWAMKSTCPQWKQSLLFSTGYHTVEEIGNTNSTMDSFTSPWTKKFIATEHLVTILTWNVIYK